MIGPNSPTLIVSTTNTGTRDSGKPQLLSPGHLVLDEFSNQRYSPLSFRELSARSSTMDINGMSVGCGTVSPNHSLDMDLHIDSVTHDENGMSLDPPDSPNAAIFAPFTADMFGPSWRSGPPLVHPVES